MDQAPVHRAPWRRGGGVAACGAHAAIDAGNRISERRTSRSVSGRLRTFRQGLKGSWLFF
jgi:hypothetical protein